MKRTVGFLVVLALCWALAPATVAHAQDDRDYCAEADEALQRYFDLEIDLEELQSAYRLCHRTLGPPSRAVPGVDIPIRDPSTGRLLPPENQISTDGRERLFPVEELLDACRCADVPRTYFPSPPPYDVPPSMYEQMFAFKN